MSFLAAITGMACRLPGGVSSPEDFWQLLTEKRDPIGSPPRDRWDDRRVLDPNPAAQGRTYTTQAGFLADLWADFDPHFFGISAREAATLDPQQRLLLTVAWEALENAGVPAARIAGSSTGVFVGGFSLDTYLARLDSRSLHTVDTHTAASMSMTMLAGRVAHSLDLRGPAISMDTACSSSLVATHVAYRSLAAGDCELALVGGVNAILLPALTIAISKGRFLSPEGRCKTFDEQANGYVRSEGAGMVVMKPFEQARADGDRIYAVVRMTGVNQDGRTAGISLPSHQAQADLLRKVYSMGGVCGADIDYIEAHGTGTQAGDLAEVTALDAVLREGRRPADRCAVGSVKSNIGHMEAAAGVVALIKSCLVLHNGCVTPNLHLNTPNPKLNLEQRCFSVTTETAPLPPRDRPWLLGVNSFGYAGTNAHVLLEQYREPVARAGEAPGESETREASPWLFPISTRDEQLLPALAETYAAFVANSDAPLSDISFSLVNRRSQHERRAVILAHDAPSLARNLFDFAKDPGSDRVVRGRVEEPQPRLAFAFSGMGPQWWGMGQQLYRFEAVYRAAVDECDAIFRGLAGWSIRDAMLAEEATSRVGKTIVAQPANFVLQVALARLLASWGIRPASVLGHSNGEIAASHVSGALSLADALLACFHRARLLDTLAGQGSMLAVGLSEEEALGLIEGSAGEVCIAAVNSAESVTLSGATEALQRLRVVLDQNEVFARPLQVEVAYHSHFMDPLEQGLRSALRELQPRAADIPMYSTVSGERLEGPELNADYWWRNMRGTVRFAAAADAMLHDNTQVTLEIGAHPVLSAYLRDAVKRARSSASVLATLSRKKPEERALREAAAAVWCAGIDLVWQALSPKGGRHVPLPASPWQRFDHWTTPPVCAWYGVADRSSWLTERTDDLDPGWRIPLTVGQMPWLNDHRLGSAVVFPGAGYVAAALMLANELAEGGGLGLSGVRFSQMLTVQPDRARALHVKHAPKSSSFQIFSRDAEGSSQLHCEGRVAHGFAQPPLKVDLEQATADLREVDAPAMYAELETAGLCYGPCFRPIERLFKGEARVMAELRLPPAAAEPETQHVLHPVLLDGALQSLACAVAFDGLAYVPTQIERMVSWGPAFDHVWSEVLVSSADRDHLVAQIRICQPDGQVVAELENVTCSAVSLAEQASTPTSALMFESTWSEVPELQPELGSEHAAGEYALVGGSPVLAELRFALQANGALTYVFDDVEQLLMSDVCNEQTSVVLANFDVTHGVGAADAPRILSEVTSCAGALALLAGRDRDLRVWVLTRGALRVGLEDPKTEAGLVGAALWSLTRVARNEHPRLSLATLDLDPESVVNWPELASLLASSGERELALRGGKCFEQRLKPHTSGAAVPSQVLSTRTLGVALAQRTPGSVESLYFREEDRRAPSETEVEVQTYETGLGFKDLLKLAGRIDPRSLEGTYFGRNIGMSATGTIVRVGSKVHDRKPGDRVLFLSQSGGFRSFATVSSRITLPLPDRLPLEEVGHVTAWTAHRALIEMARLQVGESVLIHNAAGGVGLYAVQIARKRGARVFATVSTDEKREHLLALGADAVFNSRHLDFARMIRTLTDSKGVDVVLGAVHGDVMRESLEALAIGGRYVEIGKRDIAENNALPLAPFHKNLSYAALDIDGLMANNCELLLSTGHAVMKCFESGEYQPIQATSYPASAAVAAFRALADRSRIGPLAIRFADQEVEVAREPRVRRDGTYLITGGLSGFGLEIAARLAEQGAGALVLIGRRGAVDRATQERLNKIRHSGTVVRDAALDVTDQAGLSRLLASCAESMPPLRGIFHGAMVLDDRPLLDMDPEAFAKVFRPKVEGALILHQLSLGHPIDYFVLLSSVAAQVGNPHQANYAAANAALDALAAERTAAGLPSTVINWGALGESGVIARNESLAKLLRASGIRAMKNSAALDALDIALKRRLPQVSVLDLDWSVWAQLYPRTAAMPAFAALANESEASDFRGVGAAKRLSSVPEAARADTMLDLLMDPIARILRAPRERIDSGSSLTDLGLDSLMATEATIALEQELGVKVSVALLLDGQPLKNVSSRILDQFGAHVLKNEQHFAKACAETDGGLENLQRWLSAIRPESIES